MVYLKRKLDRSFAGKLKRELAESARLSGGWDWQWLTSSSHQPSPGAAGRYARFAINRRDEDSGQPEGIFQAAYRMLREVEINEPERVLLDNALKWCCASIRAPKSVCQDAIFWYKLDDPQFTQRAWPLVKSLQRCGLDLRMMISRQVPGLIEYEDAHQVAAIPFTDVRCAVKALPGRGRCNSLSCAEAPTHPAPRK